MGIFITEGIILFINNVFVYWDWLETWIFLEGRSWMTWMTPACENSKDLKTIFIFWQFKERKSFLTFLI